MAVGLLLLVVVAEAVTGRDLPLTTERWLSTVVTIFVQLLGITLASVLVHELGHAAAAWAVGFRVLTIRIGSGPAMHLWAGDVEVQVGLVPFGGVTRAAPRTARGFRWKHVAVCGSGLIAQTLATVVVAQTLVDASTARVAWVLLGTAWIANLWPRPVKGVNGVTLSDGALILRTHQIDAETIERMVINGTAEWASVLARRGRPEQALKVLDNVGPAPHDEDWLLSVRAYALLNAGDVAGAHALYERTHSSSGGGAMTANNLAWTELLLNHEAGLPTALPLSAEAYEAVGWMAAVQNTRGLALILHGQHDEGAALIQRSLRGVDNRRDRAEVLCCLAIAEARRRRLTHARNALATARTTDPRCRMLEWAAAEVQPVEEALGLSLPGR